MSDLNDDLVYRLPEYTVDEEKDFITLSERFPEQLTKRGDFRRLQEICGAGKMKDGTPIRVGVGDTGISNTHMDGDLKGAIRKNFTRDSDANDASSGHGSHTACHIGARGQGDGILGLAPECQIVAAKVLSNAGSGSSQGIYNGVKWMGQEQKCKIINLSLGGGGFSATTDRLYKELDAAGVLVFASAGNAGQGGERGGYPARYESTLSITAVDFNKKLASFSSTTRSADYTGYGVQVLSCVARGRYARFSGTSMSCPDTVGIATLLVGFFDRHGIEVKNKAHFIELVAPGVEDLGIDGRDTAYGRGFIDIWKVIEHYGLPEEKPEEPEEPGKPGPAPVPQPGEVCGDLVFKIPMTGYGVVKLS